ncbi:MAG: hypothetical protein EOO46_07485 [Flavobacterium sp.]|nr:MAG: hypothetical protein EOO46_07485 [Flavobacterium sp.]
MSRLSNIKSSSTGSAASIAKSIQAGQAFQSLCESLTVRAYKELLKKKIHRPEWEEDTFTANFKPLIEKFCVDDGVPIHVIFQEPQLTSAILAGTVTPKAAKRMDLVFSLFSNPQYLKYGIEAKIVTSINVGSRNAKRLCNEYIISGMDRFINGSYEMAGCMVGYVVNGNARDTLNLINSNLCSNSRTSEILKDQHNVESHKNCYCSTHKNCKLKHFLFLFT